MDCAKFGHRGKCLPPPILHLSPEHDHENKDEDPGCDPRFLAVFDPIGKYQSVNQTLFELIG